MTPKERHFEFMKAAVTALSEKLTTSESTIPGMTLYEVFAKTALCMADAASAAFESHWIYKEREDACLHRSRSKPAMAGTPWMCGDCGKEL